MGIGDIRFTVLQTVQEIFRKLGMDAPGTLAANKISIEMVDYINDTCNDLSDFGNWQETVVSANIPVSSGVIDYSVSTSANIKNFGDIYLVVSGTRTGPMRYVRNDEMRLLQRSSASGEPRDFTLHGTDANGNPNIRVRPIPASAYNNAQFSTHYYTRPPRYTTSDASLVIPFPSRVIVQGCYARYLLNESGGSPTDKYTAAQSDYLSMRKEALNRFMGDTGYEIRFTPSSRYRRRR